jgi:hypothetical protein
LKIRLAANHPAEHGINYDVVMAAQTHIREIKAVTIFSPPPQGGSERA